MADYHNSSILLNVGLAKHNADWNWHNVRSPFTRIYLVTAGIGIVEMNNRAFELSPGQLFMIPAYTAHNDICKGEFVHYYMHVYNIFKGLPTITEQLDIPPMAPASPISGTAFARLVDLFGELRLPASDPSSYDNHTTLITNMKWYLSRPMSQLLESSGIINILLAPFLSSAEVKPYAKDNRILNAVNFIKANMTDKISIDDIAASVCMSKSHFIRLFRNLTGETPMVYYNRIRIENAESRLLTGTEPVKEIAYSLGFPDYDYFFKVFKRFTGRTPKCYRTQLYSITKKPTLQTSLDPATTINMLPTVQCTRTNSNTTESRNFTTRLPLVSRTGNALPPLTT